MNNVWKLLIALTLSLCSGLSQAAWTVRYQHTDVQGTAIAESNVQGSITQRFDYKPYGEGTPIQKTGIGYTGHLEDTDLGLTYMQQRYYDPVVGRFYSNDPVGFTADKPMMFNRYAYANNNPYKYTDPDGRAPDVIVDAAFTIYDAGQTLGAAAAYAEGVVTGNEALTAVAGEGLSSSATNLAISAVSMAVPGASAPMLRTVSKIEDVTKSGSKLPNMKTDVPKKEFEKNLTDNGFTSSTSKDGKTNNFTKGDMKYTTRDFSKSTGGPTADVFVKGEKVSKIRLGDNK